ncbi:Sodium:dicarboxylate symporter,Sodium:dicarboxylate symporter, conserved site [Cinara cedri]|uniref:Amino acid transporter n=3 Tax=Cinara cedri TaxID=506608 RepID=A0A5E4LX14_9HEMI|nr:Sodium:dicarboxylate symporter,Sodium:dicarboxylate symporter, conserved site [Cinara cedri]
MNPDDRESEISPLKPSKTDQGRNTMSTSRRQSKEKNVESCFSHNLLTILTIASVFGGVLLGFILKGSKTEWTKREITYVQFPGDIFLRMLKMLIVPLLVSSIISAIGSLDLSLSKKIGFQSIAYYAATTSMAVLQGIFWVMLIHPGKIMRDDEKMASVHQETRPITTVDTILDLIRNIFPANLVEATISTYRTVLIKPNVNTTAINSTVHSDLTLWKIESEMVEGSNVLGLVAFSVAFGICIGKLGPVGKPLLAFFDSLGEAVMLMTNWVIWLSPMGVLFLVASKVLELDDFGVIVGRLGMYFITVVFGLFVHGFVLLPLMYSVFTRQLPFKFTLNMGQAIITAFGTASSSASLPISMACLEENNKIDVRVSRFVMPIGATINMDGTALYEAVAAIFIAQLKGIELSFGQIAAVSVTATMASIGAAGIPQAGLVTMVMVLDTLGLPADDVSLIIAVDWLLDRFRTTVNVLGDAYGAGIVAKLAENDLELMSNESAVESGKVPDDEWHTTSM